MTDLPRPFRLWPAWPKLLMLLTLLSLGSPAWFNPAPAQQTEDAPPPSILHPIQFPRQSFQFPVDMIDPTAGTNPKGAATPGFRGENQLVVYTPAFGDHTHTNEAGFEVIACHGLVQQIGRGDSPIPAEGFVVSGHGSAAQWLAKFGRPGAQITLDAEKNAIRIQMTPTVYLDEVDALIARATGRPPVQADAYRAFLDQARACRETLAGRVDQPLGDDTVALAESCKLSANRAYYNTLPARPEEFRGAWIRPASLDPQQIKAAVAGLKAAHVSNIFLETYYQGETAYPSQVMAAYGLPEQHPQFRGGDPLALWVTEAHAQGLKVHVWAQVFFAGNQRESIEPFGPILQKYPQWRNIQRPNWNVPTPVISQIEPGHYFLDPANPEVRAFLEKLLLEAVTTHDVDGLNLDYIRYPASARPDTGYYLGTTWGYTDSGRQRFRAMIAQELAEKKAPTPAYSLDPKDFTLKHPLWPRWVAWRKEQVSSFVRLISDKAHAVKPNLLLSAVVFPSHDATYAQKLQDYPRWAREGSIQALTPIGLSPNPALMLKQCEQLKAQVQNRVPVYVGVFGLYNRAEPAELVQQIDAIHQADMPGLVLFDWSRLNPAYEQALLDGPFRE